ncbi:K+-channel ERG [Pseudocercospora fijiensis CIRAD86]|uniref:K+-channel ERG n=1 Tax=Pseudocercospora fijiensis (strain CIRAD86) TaxID=383855 RepID=N1Q9A0_PSEFD|nr:K+-channel ERG [Pseudocercospora fijiensis CIRAD86]EME89475.1 K+-channel ERG [Pseudocercospora fijiensis CIRAD86]
MEADLSSRAASPAPASVFDDIAEEPEEELTENTAAASGDGYNLASPINEEDAYNLKPPPASKAYDPDQPDIEELAVRFFSSDHLDFILRDYGLALRFVRFLQTYRPQHADMLKRYVEAKKAIGAIEYANSVANHFASGYPPMVAASVDQRFEEYAKSMAEALTDEALPAYLTYRLTATVTDTLVKEITGNSSPIMHELIPSLAEVYCLTDPSKKDNPIVYASEEFYNITQYTPEFTIGRNCRFLQGPNSSTSAVRRLISALSRGEECCETILNYKRDGTPFMNLLMLAPLYDNKGEVRYFLGAQIDVSSLIDRGRGLESFAQLLAQDRQGNRAAGYGVSSESGRDPKVVLGDLGQLLSEEEAAIITNRTSNRSTLVPSSMSSMHSSTLKSSRARPKSSRVVLGMDTAPRDLWPSANLGSNGRLPGVYQNYLLVRPYPSLRITFTSPSLRIPGLLQTKLLDRIGGPSTIREGLEEALSRGTGVTAKVTWLTSPNQPNAKLPRGPARWLHCTPLLGSDDRVGVWMIVIVEDENITGSLRRNRSQTSLRDSERGAQQYTSSKLYADYLKREGRSESVKGKEKERPNTRKSMSTGGQVDDMFRDF